MKRDPVRWLKLLEARVGELYEPLVFVADFVSAEYVLASGERIVTDELQRSRLVVVVSERVATDATALVFPGGSSRFAAAKSNKSFMRSVS